MQRYGQLWPQVVAFDNLLLAARKAQRGKRFRDNVLAFNHRLEQNLLRLQRELMTQTYQPGGYRRFEILDPKPRIISAAPYRDRVVHHALCNVIVPLLERRFIADSFANRTGYGTHRALKRFVRFARNSRYVLQCDVRKYFPSIDHSILKSAVRRYIKCKETLWLLDLIIDSGQEIDWFAGDDLLTPLEQPRGLPIGNLTSQFLANLYLNEFDHFVKEKLEVQRYLRYVDDFVLFSDDRAFLQEAQGAIQGYMEELRLTLHPVKTQLFETHHGVNFVGFRIFPNRIRIRNDNLRRARQRCHQLQASYAVGDISLDEVIQRLQSWEAHLQHGDTWRLRRRFFDDFIFQRAEQPLRPIQISHQGE